MSRTKLGAVKFFVFAYKVSKRVTTKAPTVTRSTRSFFVPPHRLLPHARSPFVLLAVPPRQVPLYSQRRSPSISARFLPPGSVLGLTAFEAPTRHCPRPDLEAPTRPHPRPDLDIKDVNMKKIISQFIFIVFMFSFSFH